MLNPLPLQIYLGILATSLSSSQKAMQSLKEELPGLNPALSVEWKQLQKKLLQKNPVELEKELQKQITEKLSGYLTSLPLFFADMNKYQRPLEKIPVIWREGSSCLYEYKGKGKNSSPILIIPSLINRHYILDLEEGSSFVKYLAGNGIDTYLAS